MKEDMTIDDIKNLVSADESRTLELKKTTGELKDGRARRRRGICPAGDRASRPPGAWRARPREFPG